MTLSCAQCGSELILISSVTEKIEGSIFPQTLTLYRCTNVVCQEARDKETEKRIKQKEEKAVADEQRAKEREKNRIEYLKKKKQI